MTRYHGLLATTKWHVFSMSHEFFQCTTVVDCIWFQGSHRLTKWIQMIEIWQVIPTEMLKCYRRSQRSGTEIVLSPILIYGEPFLLNANLILVGTLLYYILHFYNSTLQRCFNSYSYPDVILSTLCVAWRSAICSERLESLPLKWTKVEARLICTNQ